MTHIVVHFFLIVSTQTLFNFGPKKMMQNKLASLEEQLQSVHRKRNQQYSMRLVDLTVLFMLVMTFECQKFQLRNGIVIFSLC